MKLLELPMDAGLRAVARTAAGWALSDWRRNLHLYDERWGALGKVATSGAARTVPFAVSANGEELFAGLGKVSVFDARTGKKRGALAGHGSAEVSSVVAGSGWVATGGKVNSNKPGNDLRVWDASTLELRHKVVLSSARRKAPCQVERLAAAGGTDALFAVGWSPRGVDEEGSEPFARYLFRVDAATGAAQRLRELSSEHEGANPPEVQSLVATPDALALVLYREHPEERWTLELLGHDGAVHASAELEGPVALLELPARAALLAVGYESLSVRSRSDLSVLASGPLPAEAAADPTLRPALYDDGARVAYLSGLLGGVHSAAVPQGVAAG